MSPVQPLLTANLWVIGTTKVLDDVGKCTNLCSTTLAPKELNVRCSTWQQRDRSSRLPDSALVDEEPGEASAFKYCIVTLS
jgi:hypothetical protein